MKINVTYISRKMYKDAPDGLKQWRFHFHRYELVRGFILRIFGVYFNVRERNATEKLIAMAKEKYRVDGIGQTTQTKNLRRIK